MHPCRSKRAFGHALPYRENKVICNSLQRYTQHSHKNIFFHQILNAKLAVVALIGKELGIDVNTRKVVAILNAIEFPKDKTQDPETLYFSRHITDETNNPDTRS